MPVTNGRLQVGGGLQKLEIPGLPSAVAAAIRHRNLGLSAACQQHGRGVHVAVALGALRPPRTVTYSVFFKTAHRTQITGPDVCILAAMRYGNITPLVATIENREREVKVDPLPGFDSAQILPPSRSITPLQVARPIPLQGIACPCRHRNGSKILVACSCGNP